MAKRKDQKKKAADKEYYEKNHERKISQVQESRVARKMGRQTGMIRRSQKKKHVRSNAIKLKQKKKEVADERREKICQQTQDRVTSPPFQHLRLLHVQKQWG